MSAAVASASTETLDAGPSSVSRHGRVRKKNSLLAEYDSLDSLDKPRKKNEKERTPKKVGGMPKVTLKIGGDAENTPRRPQKRGPKPKKMKIMDGGMGDLKGEQHNRDYLDDEEGDLEIDLPPEYQNSLPMLGAEEIIDEGLLEEGDGATEVAENTSVNRLKSQAESTYFLEKSMEKNRKVTGPGGQPGRVKQTRKDKGSSRVTAYMLWSREQRSIFDKKNMSADVPHMSKKLSDLWATVPQNQKKMWKNKAAKIMKKKANMNENIKNSTPGAKPGNQLGTTAPKKSPAIKETTVNQKGPKKSAQFQATTPVAAGTATAKGGKGSGKTGGKGPKGAGAVSSSITKVTGSAKGRPSGGVSTTASSTTKPLNSSVNKTSAKNSGSNRRFLNSNNLNNGHSSKFSGALQTTKYSQQYSPRKEEDPVAYKVTGTAPLDVAAHFSLLGESLTIIGERLKEHEGQTVSGSLSVLLDSLLCACGPLLCLTQQVPELNVVPQEKLTRILDNIAYIMPGL